MSSINHSSSFLNIPRELQRLICEEVYRPWSANFGTQATSPPIDLLLTCKYIYRIAQSVRDEAFSGIAIINSPRHILQLASNSRLTAMITKLMINRNAMIDVPTAQIVRYIPNIREITLASTQITNKPSSINIYQDGPLAFDRIQAYLTALMIVDDHTIQPHLRRTVVSQDILSTEFSMSEESGDLMSHQFVESLFFNDTWHITAMASYSMKKFVYWTYGMPTAYVEIKTLASQNWNVDDELAAVPWYLQHVVLGMKEAYACIWGMDGHNARWRQRMREGEKNASGLRDDTGGDQENEDNDDEWIALRWLGI